MNKSEIEIPSGIELVETTEGSNGYPLNIDKAFIGFDNFQEAFSFAIKNGLEVVSLCRRDGHHFYKIEGRVWEGYDLEDFYSDTDNYFTYNIDESDLLEMFKNETESACSIDECIALGERYKLFLEKVLECDNDTQFILEDCDAVDEYRYEILPKRVMEFRYDVYKYIIGVK